MNKKLDILGKNERLVININLNKLTLSIEKKLKNLQNVIVYTEDFDIDLETELDELIENFYSRYEEKLTIQVYWENELKEATKINLDSDKEKNED